MRKGYLIFTTHDGDELDATLVDDKVLFDALRGASDNDAAMNIWITFELQHAGDNLTRYFGQAPGNYEWPFNDVEVLGTFYLLVY